MFYNILCVVAISLFLGSLAAASALDDDIWRPRKNNQLPEYDDYTYIHIVPKPADKKRKRPFDYEKD